MSQVPGTRPGSRDQPILRGGTKMVGEEVNKSLGEGGQRRRFNQALKGKLESISKIPIGQ